MDLQTALKLQQLRKEHGLSQEELADQLGVSRQAVSKWERAEASPDTDNLVCLAKLYKVSLDELLQIETIPHEQEQPPQQPVANNDEDDDEEYDEEPKSPTAKVIHALIPIVCIVAYLVCGAVLNNWHPSWIIFFAIPVLESVVICVEQKRFSAFAYPLLCAAVYLCLGFLANLWHPSWVIFVTIPLYYVIANFVDGKIKRD